MKLEEVKKLIRKADMKDSMGRFLTQGLFLEFGYNVDHAQYTLDDEDKEYKGRLYPSIKKQFIEYADVGEYDFANEFFLGWQHWNRLCANKQIAHHIDQWREELSMSLRGEGLRSMIEQAGSNSFQAAKFLIDKKWEVRSVGRPSKEATNKALEEERQLLKDYAGDVKLIDAYRKN